MMIGLLLGITKLNLQKCNKISKIANTEMKFNIFLLSYKISILNINAILSTFPLNLCNSVYYSVLILEG